MDKKELKSIIMSAGIKKQQELIDSFERRIKELRSSGKHLNDTQYDAQQASFNDETNELVDLLTGQLHFVMDEMTILKLIPSDLMTTAQMGAVVETDKMTFFLSVSLEQFEAQGKNYFGISAKAPIFGKMLGLKVGDRFEMNGAEYRILDIF